MSNSSNLGDEAKRASFAILLDKGLSISSGDRLLIVHDESLAPYGAALVDELITREISSVFIEFPKAYQRFLVGKMLTQPENQWLPAPFIVALSQSSAILNVLDGDLETGKLRKAIIDHPRTRDCRLAHIPGITDAILSITLKTDFPLVLARSELLAWFLGNGGTAKYTTYDTFGQEYQLDIDLGGWNNEPLMSPGILLPGSWGNFPPGETFCCPAPERVNGFVCIDGSVPKIVLSPEQAIVLEFREGRLVGWKPIEASPAKNFFDRQATEARQRGDDNWNVFAEFGIGLNPVISNLTGNPLFDEKVAGTIHVAIGDNTTFGHKNKADRHADLVSWKPTLEIGGITVIDRGLLKSDELTKIRAQWEAPPAAIPPGMWIRIREADVKIDSGVLKRRLCKAGRVGLVEMGQRSVGEALEKLYRILVDGESMQHQKLIERHPLIDGFDAQKLLGTLQHFNCLLLK